MDRLFRTHVCCYDEQMLFSQYMKRVQMLVIPEKGYKNVSSVKLSITDLIILGNEEPEKIYERINFAIKHKLISSKSRAQRIYEVSRDYLLYDYENKYRFTNYFMSAAIFPIIFFKNLYYPKDLYVHYKATARYRDLNRYLSDIHNIPYIDHDLYNYYYERGINTYDKETLKQNCRVITCSENKLY